MKPTTWVALIEPGIVEYFQGGDRVREKERFRLKEESHKLLESYNEQAQQKKLTSICQGKRSRPQKNNDVTWRNAVTGYPFRYSKKTHVWNPHRYAALFR